MKPNLLAQNAVDFNTIINQALPTFKFKTATLGEIISAFLPYIFVLSGLVLFVFLILGGFELLLSAGNPEKAKAAQGKITSALVGFIIVFVAYWLTQILEIIFGVAILK